MMSRKQYLIRGHRNKWNLRLAVSRNMFLLYRPMDFDSMGVMAANDTLLGLEFLCLDKACGRQFWRDFTQYPPDVTLRQIRLRAVCDWCGCLRGNGISVSISHNVFSTCQPTPQMLAERETIHQQRRLHRDLNPIGRRLIDGLWSCYPPDLNLLADAHQILGVPMCNLYSNHTTQDAMRRLFKVENDVLGNQPPLPAIFPDAEAPIVRISRDGEVELTRARWGWNKAKFGWVTNARRLDAWPWKSIIEEPLQRCLVPASSFAEYHPTERDENGHKKVVWFRLTGEDERPPFAFAGFIKRWRWDKDGLRKKADAALADANTPTLAMTFCTCEPNEIVRPIHPKAMPVIVRTNEFEQWLKGSKDEAMALQRPLPDEELEIAFVGGKSDELDV